MKARLPLHFSACMACMLNLGLCAPTLADDSGELNLPQFHAPETAGSVLPEEVSAPPLPADELLEPTDIPGSAAADTSASSTTETVDAAPEGGARGSSANPGGNADSRTEKEAQEESVRMAWKPRLKLSRERPRRENAKKEALESGKAFRPAESHSGPAQNRGTTEEASASPNKPAESETLDNASTVESAGEDNYRPLEFISPESNDSEETESNDSEEAEGPVGSEASPLEETLEQGIENDEQKSKSKESLSGNEEVAPDAVKPPLLSKIRIPLQATLPVDREAVRSELPPLTPGMKALRDQIRVTLSYHAQHAPNVSEKNPWEVMHWVIAYGHKAEVFVPGQRKVKENAINWLCWNRTCLGEPLFEIQHNLPTPRKGKLVQGHHGQWLAILAQSQTPIDYPIHVDGKSYTVYDIVEAEKLDCEPDSELTFRLIGLSHYLPRDAEWKDSQGRDWTIERMLHEEIEQPINGAACGGTHRLMGIAYSIDKHVRQGGQLTGEYYRGDRYVKDYFEYTYSLMNANGSFSTEWFKKSGFRQDEERWLQTTGHVLEWLNYTLPNDRLREPRHIQSVYFLAKLLDGRRNKEWPIGTLGHGLRALRLYDERVFQPYDDDAAVPQYVVREPVPSVRPSPKALLAAKPSKSGAKGAAKPTQPSAGPKRAPSVRGSVSRSFLGR